MAGTLEEKPVLWQIREEYGIGRERVAGRLDPPVSAKTVERWEKGITPLPGWRIRQFARIYELTTPELRAKLNGNA